eukprot:gnl/MRDRNA2_/MRDRNA2_187372_c0_seq1.p1 gnl/MRDRNA2_/MRDRNA2_187372_c0~~gnl/MRDRNA2_/MRDRNA2_187372_c0_seq1.p1  ORF type:complete len:123 (+),score=1.69 gnl/MRDRNA2_/MRDRNA2_187372_c0_seq1:80-448(+)
MIASPSMENSTTTGEAALTGSTIAITYGYYNNADDHRPCVCGWDRGHYRCVPNFATTVGKLIFVALVSIWILMLLLMTKVREGSLWDYVLAITMPFAVLSMWYLFLVRPRLCVARDASLMRP